MSGLFPYDVPMVCVNGQMIPLSGGITTVHGSHSLVTPSSSASQPYVKIGIMTYNTPFGYVNQIVKNEIVIPNQYSQSNNTNNVRFATLPKNDITLGCPSAISSYEQHCSQNLEPTDLCPCGSGHLMMYHVCECCGNRGHPYNMCQIKKMKM